MKSIGALGRRYCRRDRCSIGCWRRGSRTAGTNGEWAEFVGRFERRKVTIGDCGGSYDTPCIHEDSCLRCPLLHPDPGAHACLEEIRGNLIARIAEAESDYWHGDVEGLNTSLAGANAKLAQMDQMGNLRRVRFIDVSLGPRCRRPRLGSWLHAGPSWSTGSATLM